MRDLVVAGLAVLAALVLLAWAYRRSRVGLEHRLRRATIAAIRRFEVRLERYKLVDRRIVRRQLLEDPRVRHAIEEHARANHLDLPHVERTVEAYVDEIVPFFNVLSYYRIGYNVARALIGLLYRVTSSFQNRPALEAIPRTDVVVYLMNHRSNADYVVVAYVLAQKVSISYAVGEWARVWPLEYVFKSFGAYFVRRRFREPLYHTVLERYVQTITRNGVTQGIFLEGGLSRNGAARPAKIGLLDYILGTVTDPAFDRDIWLIPVALNYDRVLEDRSLIRELIDATDRPGRLSQLLTVSKFLSLNLLRLTTGNLKRYGRVAVRFGSPQSVRQWLAARPDTLSLQREARLARVQTLADEVLGRIAGLMPVTPVPLVSATLLSFGETAVREGDVLDRLDDYRDHLLSRGSVLEPADAGPRALLDRAWRTLTMRDLAVREGERLIILPRQRPLLEYYANSVRHLLPAVDTPPAMGPADDPDRSLPRLRMP